LRSQDRASTPNRSQSTSSNMAPNGFEKHAQTAIQVILVAITIWVGSSIITLRDSTIQNTERNQQMREAIVELKTEIAALRTVIANMAERDLIQGQRLQNLDNRVDKLEQRLAGRRREVE